MSSLGLVPLDLRCAHKQNPLGVEPDRARFAWRCAAAGPGTGAPTGRWQSAYQVMVGLDGGDLKRTGAVTAQQGHALARPQAEIAPAQHRPLPAVGEIDIAKLDQRLVHIHSRPKRIAASRTSPHRTARRAGARRQSGRAGSSGREIRGTSSPPAPVRCGRSSAPAACRPGSRTRDSCGRSWRAESSGPASPPAGGHIPAQHVEVADHEQQQLRQLLRHVEMGQGMAKRHGVHRADQGGNRQHDRVGLQGNDGRQQEALVAVRGQGTTIISTAKRISSGNRRRKRSPGEIRARATRPAAAATASAIAGTLLATDTTNAKITAAAILARGSIWPR